MYNTIKQLSLLVFIISPVLSSVLTGASADDITQLNIEELMAREVTSVSRSAQKLIDSAAAVFVVTQEDIQRSGATSLPEILRMVPGVHVARLNANEWAITIRGFNGLFANKLLVLIDGRSVYTPISAGIFWETLDIPLADIERIEVIRGPGASLWGANAVNGIINVITKSAQETQGGYLDITVGNEDKLLADIRYGIETDDSLQARIFAKYAKRDSLITIDGDDADDDWDLLRGGFRIDWLASVSDRVMLQGDVYDNDMQRNFQIAAFDSPTGAERLTDTADFSGYHLLGRWEQTLSLSSRTTLQLTYQRDRQDSAFQRYTLDTFDIDFQHETALDENQELIWGLGYRHHQDDFSTAQLTISPEERNYRLFSAFMQDQIRFFDRRVEITAGAKIENNSFTGWEFQPSLRVLWQPSTDQRFWAAISRATRTPSRGEHDSVIEALDVLSDLTDSPTRVIIQGNKDLGSEELIAYEIGYRFWPFDNLYIDIAGFYNDYDDLRFGAFDALVTENDNIATAPAVIFNGEEGKTYGLELAADWRPADWWRLQFSYSFLRADFRFKDKLRSLTTFPENLGDERNPRHQFSLRSSFDLSPQIDLDMWLRYVDDISDIQVTSLDGVGTVDDYLTLDLRLAWRPSDDLELSIAGRNLIDTPHLEYLKEFNTFPTQVERSVYGRLQWRF